MLGRKRPSQPASLEKQGVGMYGVGARNSPISLPLPDRPQRTFLIPEVELETDQGTEAGRVRDKGRKTSGQVPIEMPPVTLPPAQRFDFSASPFRRWNTKVQRGSPGQGG